MRLALPALLIWGFTWQIATAQLVNIESKRMQTDSVRFALKADALFHFSKQNEDDYFAINSNLTTQFKSKDLKKIYFILGNYNLVRAADKDYQNSWFIHLRYNQKITHLFRIEAFMQYQKNELLVIDAQYLFGAGIRFKVISETELAAYVGNSLMYEIEQSTDFDQMDYHWRNSTYFTITYSPEGNKVHLVNTIYFQPLYQSLGNHRILEQFKIEVPVTAGLSVSGSYNYSLISVTPANERDSSSNIYFGFTYTR